MNFVMQNDCEDDDGVHNHMLFKPGADTGELEARIMGWFLAGHEVMWIPIYEVAPGPDGLARARAHADEHGGARLIPSLPDCMRLPIGIKGWLFPAHLDDTDVICTRLDRGEVDFSYLVHPVTHRRITYRFRTERAIDNLSDF